MGVRALLTSPVKTELNWMKNTSGAGVGAGVGEEDGQEASETGAGAAPAPHLGCGRNSEILPFLLPGESKAHTGHCGSTGRSLADGVWKACLHVAAPTFRHLRLDRTKTQGLRSCLQVSVLITPLPFLKISGKARCPSPSLPRPLQCFCRGRGANPPALREPHLLRCCARVPGGTVNSMASAQQVLDGHVLND